MRRSIGFLILGSALLAPAASFGQTTPPPEDTRPALVTVMGDTGIWFVPTAETLTKKRWSVSLQRTNIDDGQGFTDISTFPVTFGYGLGRAEIFGSWAIVTRIDRDTRPLFFASRPEEENTGTGGGIVVDHPLVRSQWIGNKLGDFWVGGKVGLWVPESHRAAVAVRAMVKLPIGDEESGASSGKMDSAFDGIVSMYHGIAEISGYAGIMLRGSPDGYDLTNGLRWGVGAAFPQRYSGGFRISAELYGEKYFDDEITAPAGQFGVDGSPVPTSSFVRGPVVGLLGLTWQAPNGFFAGAAAGWNFTMNSRDEASPILALSFPSTPKDDKSLQFRIGFHPGARRSSAFPAAPGAPGAPAAQPRGAEPPGAAAKPPAGPPAAAVPPPPVAAPPPVVNGPPTVKAQCDPCTVPLGGTSTVTANATDPDGDALTYAWKASTGKFAVPTARQTTWTAPQAIGTYPVTVTVNDGKGHDASDTVEIRVVRPEVKEYTFDDVHFDFDRSMIRADARETLDQLANALRADPNLRVEIEGHTDSIGTAEYNMALGERRAAAVRSYLTNLGINPDRMTVVSYGEERPRFENTNEDNRRQNRRAALVVRVKNF